MPVCISVQELTVLHAKSLYNIKVLSIEIDFDKSGPIRKVFIKNKVGRGYFLRITWESPLNFPFASLFTDWQFGTELAMAHTALAFFYIMEG